MAAGLEVQRALPTRMLVPEERVEEWSAGQKEGRSWESLGARL